MISILVNGEQQDTVSVLDRGFVYGDGLFETLAVRDGRPLLWAEHLARLRQGSQRLGLPDFDEQTWAREAQAVCSGQAHAVLKLMWTRGPSERGYLAPAQPRPTRIVLRSSWPRHPRYAQRDGVSIRVCRHFWSRQPQLSGLKHLNRLDNVLARNEWSHEYAEGLMCDEQGFVVSGTASNLFALIQGTLWTPELTHAGVEGVMRAQVLATARTLSVPVRIGQISLPMLMQEADEVFLTNSIIGIWPVIALEGQRYEPGLFTRCLLEELRRQGILVSDD